MAERPYKKSRHKLNIEKSIICIRDIKVLPQTLIRDILKSVHNDVDSSKITTKEVWSCKLVG